MVLETFKEVSVLLVREVFATLQGEGSRAGQPAIFVRFAGCNLWSGLAGDRESGAGECALWCDTDFAKGSRYHPDDLVKVVLELASASGHARPFVVLTGGEPLLQLARPDGLALLWSLRLAGAELALETNGTRALGEAKALLDHVTVSPKALRGKQGLGHIMVREGTDLKVVHPWPFEERDLLALAQGFGHLFVQPLDTGDTGRAALPGAINAAAHLGWRVSLQSHKMVGLA